MKDSHLSRHVLCVCVVAISLTACGGSQIGTSQTREQALPFVVRTNATSLHGESFSSDNGADKCITTPAGPYADFKATGKASGPFPGTFRASGKVMHMEIGSNRNYYFNESFEIKSGSQTISGTAHREGKPGKWISFACRPGHGDFALTGAHYRAAHSQPGETSATLSKPNFKQTFD